MPADLDILLTGTDSSWGFHSQIYRNDNGNFVDINAGLEGVAYSSAQWGDYDNDGDLDILLAGTTSYSGEISRIYRNDDGSFVNIAAGLPGVFESVVSWGDYDNDGDLDILLTGYDIVDYISRIYRNDDGSFVNAGVGLPGLENGSVHWGDYDNDGDLDILLTGRQISEPITRIYRNDAGSFVELDFGLQGVWQSSARWGDYDNDGDLDVLLSGNVSDYVPITRIYRNNGFAVNTPPTEPLNLELAVGDDILNISWDPAADQETATAGLSYNLRIGIPDHPDAFKSGMADSEDGYRLLPAPGNANQVTGWTLQFPGFSDPQFLAQETRTLITAVQAVDNALAGGPWTETVSQQNPDIDYLALTNVPLMGPEDLLAWELRHIDELTGFELQVAVAPDFATVLLTQWIPFEDVIRQRESYLAIEIGDLDDFALIEQDVTHYWRIRPVYPELWRTTVFSETPAEFILVEPLDPPQAFTITIVEGRASLTWDPVPGNFVYYIVYSSTEAHAPFPEGWQVEGTPTVETAWMDPELATGQKFYRVKAVVIE